MQPRLVLGSIFYAGYLALWISRCNERAPALTNLGFSDCSSQSIRTLDIKYVQVCDCPPLHIKSIPQQCAGLAL